MYTPDMPPDSGLTQQIVTRVDDEMLARLERDAADNGRTVSQSVRFLLGKALAASAKTSS